MGTTLRVQNTAHSDCARPKRESGDIKVVEHVTLRDHKQAYILGRILASFRFEIR